MNLKFLKLIVLCLTFLYLVNIVSANLGYYSETDVLKACRCSEIEDSLMIKNTGTELTNYKLSSNLNFVEFMPAEFSLEAGKVQDVTLLIKAPCKTQTKNLKIKATSDKDDEVRIVKTIIMGQCQNLKAGLESGDDEINPCEASDYNIHIWNTGSFTETYLISSNLNEINISNSSIEILPGEKAEVSAELLFSCDVYGDKTAEFYIQAEQNHLDATLKHDFIINQYYAYSLDVHQDPILCEEEVEPVKITIENDVSTPNKYNFELVGAPLFVHLSNSSISLEGDGVGYLELILDIEEGKHLGDYNFILKSMAEYGDISVDKNISLKVQDCYDISIDFQEHDIDFCSGEKETTVKIKNNGERAENIALSSNFDWANFNMQKVFLEPGEEIDAVLTLNPVDADAIYDLSVEASLTEKEISKLDHAHVQVISQGTCYFVIADKTKYAMKSDKENSTAIKLTNQGYEWAEYELSLDAPEWLSIDQKTITLASRETGVINLISDHTAETPLWLYPITLTLKTGEMEYVHELDFALKDKCPCVKAYEYFSVRPCQAASVLLILAIVVLALFAFFLKKPRGKVRKKHFRMFVWLIIILLLVFGGLIYYYIGEPVLNEPIDTSKASETYFVWEQDENYELPLESFVEDPDADELTLSVLDADEKNVQMSVEEGKITFTPTKGWYGVEIINIFATDSLGASAQSPDITLEVVKKDSFSLMEAYIKLCWYVNWILLLLAFTLLTCIAHKRIRGKNFLFNRS